MIVFFVVIAFFLFSYLLPLIREIEQRDALLLNATLSTNATQFLSESVLQHWLNDNATATSSSSSSSNREGHQQEKAAVEPDWALVLGTFHHYKDENFEAFLISAGLSFFTRAIILNTSPSLTFDRVFEGDDYYYDLSDYSTDRKYEEEAEKKGEGKGGSEDTRKTEDGQPNYQMVLTTSLVVTRTQRFKLGRPFAKQDYDGTPSTNTYFFRTPTVLVHLKEKQLRNTTIIHTFDEAGLITTIISGKTGMQARRHFRRASVSGSAAS